MLTRRDTVRAIAAAGVATPLVAACGGGARHRSASAGGVRLVGADVARSAGSAAAVPDVVGSMAAFTTGLWPHLAGPGDNLALSPYSVAVALAMAANGAVGPTRSQMLDSLRIGSLAGFNSGIAALTQDVEALAGPVTNAAGKPGEIALAAANALFGDRETTWATPFLTVLAQQYGAGMRAVDFRGAPEQARVAINGWTSEQTHARIPELLPVGAVDALTRLVLVDALYLKAPWHTPFERSSTARRPFRPTPGSSVDVDMMSAGEGVSFIAGRHYRGARLPYAGRQLAMTVALPDGDEQQALAGLLGDLGGATAPQGVRLSMPRWTFRSSCDLTDPLRALGMTQAFTGRADFAAMTNDDRLRVADVLHQAFVAVDEDGTEAAAATAVVMEAQSGEVDPQTLVLDRPFLFAIHDTAHGTPLFVGRVADPS